MIGEFYYDVFVRKKEIINSKPKDVNVRAYCENIGVSYSSYYKWIKEIISYCNDN